MMQEKLRFPLSFFLIIFLVLISCGHYKNYLFERNIQKALDYENKEEYKKALVVIEKCLKIHENSVEALIVRGKLHNQLEQHDAAIQDFTKALLIEPKNIVASFHKGVSFYALDQLDSSIFYYNSAIKQKGSDTLNLELNPNGPRPSFIENDIPMPVIRYYRGLSFYHKKINNYALSDFTFCIEEDYNKENALLYSGTLYLSNRDTTNGCKCLRLAEAMGLTEAKEYIAQYCK